MCVLSRAVRHVGKTQIFVGHRSGGERALIYAMERQVRTVSGALRLLQDGRNLDQR